MLAIDWDGTLADTFSGRHFFLQLKLWFFKKCRFLYSFADIAEALISTHCRLHNGARELVEWASDNRILVGIVTDRTLFAFVRSSEGARFDLKILDFIHARKGFLNSLIEVPDDVAILETQHFKGEPNALTPLMLFAASRGIRPEEILLVGDDKRDILAAAHCGIYALEINRYAPDFDIVRRCIERENSN